MSEMKIALKAGDKIVTATVAENETARDFVSLLPLSLSMKDLFGREKYATLPRPLSEAGPRTKTYEVGLFAYWSPSRDVAIYYLQDEESIPLPGIILIAKIDSSAEAFCVSGSVKVSFEVLRNEQ